MPIVQTFSKRKAQHEGRAPDVYQYDNFPLAFRRQVILILIDAIGAYYAVEDDYRFSNPAVPPSNTVWKAIYRVMTRELGVFHLGKEYSNPYEQCQDFIQSASTDQVLDIIEVAFKIIDGDWWRGLVTNYNGPEVDLTPDSAIADLNGRFEEHGLGYAFEASQIIRKDSQYLHSEAVKPALRLLSDARFAGAEQEFLHAHDHYRKGEYKDSISDAGKALESTLKAICDAKKWKFDQAAAANTLIGIIFEEGLIPGYLQSEFTAVRSLLESGLPTVRNKSTSSHGQGTHPIAVPYELATFALNQAATNIVYLIQSFNALP